MKETRMTYDLRDSEGTPVKVGDEVMFGDEVAIIKSIQENDEGTHGSTTLLFQDGVEDTFPNMWNATGPWDDYRSDYHCDEFVLAACAASNFGAW